MTFLDALPDAAKAIGSIFEHIRGIIRNFIKDPNDADKAATEISLAVIGVVQAEVGSRFWLAGNWRPICMLLICSYMLIQGFRGVLFDMRSDVIFFVLLISGLAGYQLDGRILQFAKELFTFGQQAKQDRPARPEQIKEK